MKQKLLFIIAGMCIAGLCIGSYQPAPPVLPDGVQFDPNQTPYDIVCAEKIWLGTKFIHPLFVIETDGETITATATVVTIRSITATGRALTSPAKEYKIEWEFNPPVEGVYYPEFTIDDGFIITDPNGTVRHPNIVKVSTAIQVVKNNKPIVTGCRSVQ